MADLCKDTLEAAAKIADAEAQRCRDAIAKCEPWSPVQAEWSRARDACLNIAENIRERSNG